MNASEPTFSEPAIQSGFHRLIGTLTPEGLIPYYPGLTGAAEASLMGLLAFAAHDLSAHPIAQSILEAVLKLQNPDGSTCAIAAAPGEGVWVTSQFAVAAHLFARQQPRDRALEFLTGFKSLSLPNSAEMQQDNTLVGWPWTKATFGWVEPTSWAVIALSQGGKWDHPRAREGRALILDRMITGGGWNCGNPQVYGNDLLPFVDTTGLALLALIGRVQPEQYKPSLEYLERLDPSKETLYGTALALMALAAGERPADGWRKALLERLTLDLNGSADDGCLHLGTLALALAALGPVPTLNRPEGKN